MLYLLLVMVFITIIIFTLQLYSHYAQNKPIERIETYYQSEQQIQSRNDIKPFKSNIKEKYNDTGKKLINILALNKYTEKLDRTLERANILFTVQEMILIIFLATIIATFIGTVITGTILLGIVFGIASILLFKIIIDRKTQKRIKNFDDQLSSALDMIVSSLRGGFSFINALELISKEMPPPISQEFAHVLKEIKLGNTLEKALNNLLERVQSEDLELIITATLIQIHTGGNLAEILDNISSTIRERILLKREVKTLTAQGKMSGWILALLPIFLAIVISMLDPEYIGILLNNTIGKIMIVIATLNEIIGFIIIKKMLDIKY